MMGGTRRRARSARNGSARVGVKIERREESADRTSWAVRDGVLVVRAPVRGRTSIVTEVAAIVEGLVRGGDFRSPLQAVVDVRHSAFSPTGSEIRRGVIRLRRLGRRGRIALLVSSDFQFGLGRMIGLLSEDSGFEVRPFRDAVEAASWVGEPNGAR